MSCVTQCPYGTYGDHSDPTQKVCILDCPDGWFSDDSNWTCTQVCPTNPSLYADISTGTCVAKCREDLNQFAYDGDRTCVDECPSPTQADIYTRRCLNSCLLEPSTYLYVNGTLR